MPQRLLQQQEQVQRTVQRLTAQQMQQVRLLEMPLAELEQDIEAQLGENPALESEDHDEDVPMMESDAPNRDDEDFETRTEREEREEALDAALDRFGSDDRMPDYAVSTYQHDNADYEEIVYGDTTSFIDKMHEQVAEHELTDHERTIIDYLIGSLDDDGLLRKPLDAIADELAIYNMVDTNEAEVEHVLRILQDFDPAGIGARTLQECLLLQIDRKLTDPEMQNDGIKLRALSMLRTIIADHFEAFTRKHWEKIQSALSLTSLQMDDVKAELRKLNPKPGASMGETQGRNIEQITPDFIVDTDDDGHVTFYLNNGHVPELHISQSFADMLAAYKDNKKGLTRTAKEALLYTKEKVDRAQGYIEAIKQRQRTLTLTMKTIIELQKKFFQDGDESDLRPMILKDVADRTGLDISTVSRVGNAKYAQTKWGIFPLRYFFSDGYTTDTGEELSTRKIKLALRDIINGENKAKPLSDEALAALMKKQGYPIARRTVAKYREQMGLPVARLRRE